MPILRVGGHDPEEDAELVDELVREITANDVSVRPPGAVPLIIEEAQRHSDRIHVAVVWEKWRGIEASRRASIILDAYEKAQGRDSMLQIAFALGLTVSEAESLGLERHWRQAG